jgi:16S rRNA (uracil1498-N3)-methyltransferase
VEPWDTAVGRVTGERVTGETARFCLFERAREPLGPALSRALALRVALAFAVGPEGGLADDEVEQARSNGFEPVSLGNLILRTETVVTAVLGAVRILLPPGGSR